MFSIFDHRTVSDQCIALAGLLQALEQVQQCARFGEPSDSDAMNTVLNSTLRIDASDTLAVYGELENLRPGLELLAQHLSKQRNSLRLEQVRYGLSLLTLEGRLAKSPAAAQLLIQALQTIQDNREHPHMIDHWMIQQLASAYSDHVSVLGARIMVSGEPMHLKSAVNAARIRALLLAGLRATVLWRQVGGGRFKLLVLQPTMRHIVADLLARTSR